MLVDLSANINEVEFDVLVSGRLSFEFFDIDQIISKGNVLLASSGKEFDVEDSFGKKISLQRMNLKKTLGIGEGMLNQIDNTLDLISDEDLISSKSSISIKAETIDIPVGLSARERNALKRKSKQSSSKAILDEKKPKLETHIEDMDVKETEDPDVWPFQPIIDDVCVDLFKYFLLI